MKIYACFEFTGDFGLDPPTGGDLKLTGEVFITICWPNDKSKPKQVLLDFTYKCMDNGQLCTKKIRYRYQEYKEPFKIDFIEGYYLDGDKEKTYSKIPDGERTIILKTLLDMKNENSKYAASIDVIMNGLVKKK